jgi:hypothetical protein
MKMENPIEPTPLIIDTATGAHMLTAATWARFIGITGMVLCGLIVLFGLFAGSLFSMLPFMNRDLPAGISTGIGVMMAFIYIGAAALYFFPCLFLLRYANAARAALATGSQERLTYSIQNLKKMFRFVGVLTIIVVSIYLFVFLIAMLVMLVR